MLLSSLGLSSSYFFFFIEAGVDGYARPVAVFEPADCLRNSNERSTIRCFLATASLLPKAVLSSVSVTYKAAKPCFEIPRAFCGLFRLPFFRTVRRTHGAVAHVQKSSS